MRKRNVVVRGIISRFELAEPSLTDIFIEQVVMSALPDTPSVLSA